MKTYFKLVLSLGIISASMSSCSRANYAFNDTTPASTTVEMASSAANPAADGSAVVTASLQAAPVAEAVPTYPTSGLAHHKSIKQQATAIAAAVKMPVVSAKRQATASRAERKALRQQVIRQLAAPTEAAADGKSQTTALILCILLGGIGVHQFYLGYTGRGILRIALALTSFLIVPAIVNLVLYILDIIKIIDGKLKPRDGEYAKKFNN
jgi:TM2 domain-containing membrane protein YozV